MNEKKDFLIPLAALTCLFLAAAGLAWFFRTPAPEYIQGEVEAAQVDLASKIPGRVERILVKEGDWVEEGGVLVMLSAPEVEAKLDQASAAEEAAQAQKNKAEAGARREEIQAAENLWRQAVHAADLAEKTYLRVQALFDDGIIPAQKRDEAETRFQAARDQARAARASYDMALAGARKEDKAAASALVNQAAGAVSEVRDLLKETRLIAPMDGEVALVPVDPGELVAAGFPVVVLVDLSDVWVVFQLREDLLTNLRMGSEITASFPALGGREALLKVSFISPLGDFAVWRATNASGGFDLKTFEIHARPVNHVEGLRPGMSALVPLENLTRANKN